MFISKVWNTYQVIASGKWYHGSQTDLPIGRLKTRSKKWKAFDGADIDEPFWLTASLKFANLHGGKVYECKIHIPISKIFADRDLVGAGRYWSDMAQHEGKTLYEALERGDLFPDVENFESVFKSIVAEDYDIIETYEFISWAKAQGFQAAYVQGDGERNLIVFDQTLVEVINEVSKQD